MQFTTIFGETIDKTCAGCVVMDNSKFLQGRIYQTKLWDLSQDFEIAYPGMVVLSPMRHVSNYMDLTEEKLKELHILTVHCKKAIMAILNCQKITYMFYEKPNGHIHFVIIPLHGLIDVQDKYSVLGELSNKMADLCNNKENMLKVINTIDNFRKYFNKITL